MKRIHQIVIVFLVLSFLPMRLLAQFKYGNEWIEQIGYNKTFYKFKVGKNGIYRINKAALDAAGVPPNITGKQFMLFRNGQEVPLFTTTDNSFSSNDYIEFYGTKNDGKPLDSLLYGDPNIHADDRISLFSD